MEFSIASLSMQELSGVSSQNEQKQSVKTAPGPQIPKPSQGGKTIISDGFIPARKEDEASFWKINAERSKFEGEQSKFCSLTPSQIKSMEKGEKTLQPYYRQESGPKEASKAEKPNIMKPEKPIAPSLATTSVEWEKPQPGQPSVSSTQALPEPVEKLPSPGTKSKEPDSGLFSDLQELGQNNTSNVILKTGFDFLDNW
uniref:Uncharacterized protein n=2 Tax=Sphaerodactylus townsendi TaxID=933632 RepID=A0ACB8GBL4_9SAUR